MSYAINPLSFYQEPTEQEKIRNTAEFYIEQYSIKENRPVSDEEFFKELGVEREELKSMDEFNNLLTEKGLREKILVK